MARVTDLKQVQRQRETGLATSDTPENALVSSSRTISTTETGPPPGSFLLPSRSGEERRDGVGTRSPKHHNPSTRSYAILRPKL